MPSKVQILNDKGLISPPKWLPKNIHYETIMGSMAYGVSSDTSDMDIYGFAIPPKEVIFPHLSGEILGFGRQKKRFEQYQQHGIESPDELANKGRVYDISIYNIVKYFTLCMENNPNMIDSLYTPITCVLHSTSIGQMVREKRDIFLHKGSWHKFKGYSYSQIQKIKNKNPEGKRKKLIEKHGFDVKFAYHTVRLLSEVEMILSEGTLDLQRNKEQLKSIRRGDWTEKEILSYFNKKEKELETLYVNSKLRHSPDEEAIKNLLLGCLEHHYGSLDKCVTKVGVAEQYLTEIKAIVDKWSNFDVVSQPEFLKNISEYSNQTDPEIPEGWQRLLSGSIPRMGDRMWDGSNWRWFSIDAINAEVKVMPHEWAIRATNPASLERELKRRDN